MRLDPVKLYLLSNYPFYYNLLQQCRIQFDVESKYPAYVKVQTRIEITINPEMLALASVPTQAGILIHELQHVFKDHIKQSHGKQIEAISDALGIMPNYQMANVAMDFEINPGIEELVKDPTLGQPDAPDSPRIVFPKDMKFQNGDSWFNYYARMKGQANIKKGHQDHEYFKESIKDEKMLQEVAANAAKKAKSLTSAGSTPREIKQFLLDYEASKQLPWYLILRQFMQSLVDVNSKNTWKKANRRFRGKLPGAKKLPRLDLLIGIDSSGSVADEQLKAFYSEVEAINQTGMCTIEIAVFDTVVHQREKYKKGFEAKRLCSGGTSFTGIHDIAVEERFKGVVYLTDGYAEFPAKEDVNYKVLWVLNNEDVKPPYGSVARIK